jgi:photosystem II stability/assembly factor-like uncharacterized protein
MRRLILILAIVFQSVLSQAQWVLQALGYEKPNVLSLYPSVLDNNTIWTMQLFFDFIDSSYYWAKTFDGGNHWEATFLPFPKSYTLGGLRVVNESTAFLAATDLNWYVPNLWKTTDTGSTWQQINVFGSDTAYLYSFHFWDSLNGLCFGLKNNGNWRCDHTYDSGLSWTQIDSINIPVRMQGEDFTGLYQVFGDTIFRPTNKRILRSTDHGQHWFWSAYPGSTSIDQFFCMKNGLRGIFGYTGSGSVFKETLNGGISWSTFTPQGPFYRAFTWVPGTTNTCVSTTLSPGGASYSFDGGHTWSEFQDAIGIPLGPAVFTDVSHGWAGTYTPMVNPASGGMYHFNGTLVEILEQGSKNPDIQVYPVPATDIVNVVIQDGLAGRYEIRNSCGQLIKSGQVEPDGTFKHATIDVRDLSKGIYLLSIIHPRFTNTRKIIIE